MNGLNQLIFRTQKSVFSFVFILSFLFQSLALATGSFPEGPELSVTPGKLCESSAVKRYPEQISYCARNVSPSTKDQLIKLYDEKFGYQVQKMNRADFKIDHFIPLSIGGSNSIENLWPQNKSIYAITDPIEQALSGKIAVSKIKQDEAVKLMREAKLNLSKAPEILKYIQGL